MLFNRATINIIVQKIIQNLIVNLILAIQFAAIDFKQSLSVHVEPPAPRVRDQAMYCGECRHRNWLP